MLTFHIDRYLQDCCKSGMKFLQLDNAPLLLVHECIQSSDILQGHLSFFDQCIDCIHYTFNTDTKLFHN